MQQLESLQRAGVRVLARVPVDAHAWRAAQTVSDKATEVGVTEDKASEDKPTETVCNDSVDRSLTNQKKLLATLQAEVAACTLCEELATSRTQTVFGVGNPRSRLCFFGEAPGADEDRLGEPFVGRAGKLLTDIIQKGMGLERSDVYILNVLKCRPPGNRNPNSDEAANCRHFFERQLDIIQPEFICCLGSVAAHTLLDTTQTIGRLRGRFHDYRGIKVVVTYHPAYLLRAPSAKKATWEDIRMLLEEMGLPIPKRTD